MQSLVHCPPPGTSLHRPHQRVLQSSLCAAAPSVPAYIDPMSGHRNLYFTDTLGTIPCRSHRRAMQSLLHRSLSEPACTGPINGNRNMVCPAPAASVSACTSPTSGYGSLYCAATLSVTTCSNLNDGSSNKATGSNSQWGNYSNSQSSQNGSSQQLTRLSSRIPFHSYHRFRLHTQPPSTPNNGNMRLRPTRNGCNAHTRQPGTLGTN